MQTNSSVLKKIIYWQRLSTDILHEGRENGHDTKERKETDFDC